MTANMNIPNKPVMPEQVTPVLKAVAHPSKEKETEYNNIRSVDTTKAEKETEVSSVNKSEKTDEENKEAEQTLDDAVKQLNSYAQSINRNLEFNIDNDSGKTVVKVIDAETDELIRQIPDEEALNITKTLEEKLSNESTEPGLLLTKLQA